MPMSDDDRKKRVLGYTLGGDPEKARLAEESRKARFEAGRATSASGGLIELAEKARKEETEQAATRAREQAEQAAAKAEREAKLSRILEQEGVDATE